MIARLWHGWTRPAEADAYEELLRSEVLPGIRVDGYRGVWLLRRSADDEVEFVTVTFWSSWEAIRAFAGSDLEVAVVPPAARALLSRFDERSAHFEVVAGPEA